MVLTMDMVLTYHVLSVISCVTMVTISYGLQTNNGSFNTKQISAEKRLVRRLLNSYNKIGKVGRPVRNSSSPVNVKFGLGLIQMELNEKDKILAMSMWTRYQWTDEYLQWDPSEHGGIEQLKLDPNSIWAPDILLYNTADVLIEQRIALAVVHFSGTVFWFPHSIFKATCSVDVTNFPFDEQQCNMAFGSWTHNSKEIDLHMGMPSGIDLSTFQADHKESSSWDVLNVTATKSYLPDPNEEPNFAVLTFEIFMKRKLVFSSYILTLPCVFLASLTLVVFWLPAERPDRTGLAMSVFSSFMLLLLILVEAAPPTASSVPILGVYYCFNMVIIVMSVVLSALIVNITKGVVGKRPSRVLRFIFLKFFSKVFCMKLRSAKLEEANSETAKKNKGSKGEMKRMLGKDHKTCNGADNYLGKHFPDNGYESYRGLTDGRDRNDSVNDNLDIRRYMSRLEARIDNNVQKEKDISLCVLEWRDCANVMDRLFFVIYLILIIISLTVFFPRPAKDNWASRQQ